MRFFLDTLPDVSGVSRSTPALPPLKPDSGVASARFVSSLFYGALSASYAASDNWAGQNTHNYAVTSNVAYRHNSFGTGWGHAHHFMADMGYLRFVDSTWVKNIDRLQTNFLWNGSGRRLNQSYAIAFASQFLPNKVMQYDFAENRSKEQKVGGFLNPFTLDIGYGAVWTFWSTSNLNFAFATLRLSSSPKETTAPAFTDVHVVEGRNAYYFLTYGFSIAATVNRSFGQHVQWLNNTRVFGNGMDRDHVNFDFSNMVIIKLWKYLQVRLDTRLAYNPMLNYNMQFRQEVLLGFFYERKR